LAPTVGAIVNAGDEPHEQAGGAVAVHVVHARLLDRTRFRVPRVRHDGALAARLARELRQRPEIDGCRVDALTGSVLLRHRRGVTTAALTAALRQAVERLAPSPRWSAPTAAAQRSAPDLPFAVAASAATSQTRWHCRSVEDVLAELDVAPAHGLPRGEVLRRRQRFGSNRLSVLPGRSSLAILLEQFVSLPVAMLGGSALISIATRARFDALVTVGVVATNAVIGWLTESSAQKLIGRITSADDVDAAVLRDGVERRVPAWELVPGDMLVLRRGDPVAADARLLESHSLMVNESLLTGENATELKDAREQLPAATPLAERANLVFMGTTIAGGSGRAVVVAIGDGTEIGRIQAVASRAVAPPSPIEADLERLGRHLAIGALAICAVAFGLGVLRGHGALQILKSAIALAVAAVPEGLPTIATSTLAVGLRRMRNENMLVRRLEAVEGLGSLEVLCLDKTGTLTENRLRVTGASLHGQRWHVDGELAGDDSRQVPLPESAALRRLAETALLAAEVAVEDYQDGLDGVSGTERALAEFAQSAGVDTTTLNRRCVRRDTRLRDELHNYVAVTHDCEGQTLVAVKGRPGEVLALCTRLAVDGREVPLDDELVAEIHRDNDLLAAEGLRVLGVAYGGPADAVRAEGQLVWCGLLGMRDVLRPNTASVVRRFHDAGVRTVMITGDQAPTAMKVAEELDLAAGEPLQILDAGDLDRLDPEMLSLLASRSHVFARVSPVRKLEIVQALQHAGRVVGMTGDGINDGPALKAADVGIAMGRSGTRIARDVADVVIQDDDLEHLLEGMAEGRMILANIRKSLHFLLATNLSEIFVVFAEILRGPRELESPMELFWINLVTDLFPSIGLALEPPAPDVLEHPPRGKEPLMDGAYYRQLAKEASIIGGTSLAAHFYALARHGAGPRTRSVTFFALVSAQLLHAMTCRRDRFQRSATPPISQNPAFVASLGAAALLQGVALLLPGLRRLLGIDVIDVADLAVIAGASGVSYLVNEAVAPGAKHA